LLRGPTLRDAELLQATFIVAMAPVGQAARGKLAQR